MSTAETVVQRRMARIDAIRNVYDVYAAELGIATAFERLPWRELAAWEKVYAAICGELKQPEVIECDDCHTPMYCLVCERETVSRILDEDDD